VIKDKDSYKPRVRVLLVEDDPIWRNWLSKEVKKCFIKLNTDAEIHAVSTPREASKQITKLIYDAIMVDFHFPNDIMGDEFIAGLRDTENVLYTAVISGVSDQQSLAEALFRLNNQGACVNYFLTKSKSEPELFSLCANMLLHVNRRPMIEPLRTSLGRFRYAAPGSEQFTAFRALSETVVKISTHIMLSCAYKEGILTDPFSKFDPDRFSGFGTWLSLLTGNLRKVSVSANLFARELADIFSKPLTQGGLSLLKFLETVRDLRNTKSGTTHLVVKDKGYIEDFFKTWSDQCGAITESVKRISYWKILVPDRISVVETKDGYKAGFIDGIILNSINDGVKRFLVHQHEVIEPHLVYLFNPVTGALLKLDPLVKYQYCNKCERYCLFLFEQFKTDKLLYYDTENHEVLI
jgi:CheY-like chemotaxis protein